MIIPEHFHRPQKPPVPISSRSCSPARHRQPLSCCFLGGSACSGRFLWTGELILKRDFQLYKWRNLGRSKFSQEDQQYLVSRCFNKKSAGKLETLQLTYTSEATVERDFQTWCQVQGVGKPHGARTLTDVLDVSFVWALSSCFLHSNIWLSFFEVEINSIGWVDPISVICKCYFGNNTRFNLFKHIIVCPGVLIFYHVM